MVTKKELNKDISALRDTITKDSYVKESLVASLPRIQLHSSHSYVLLFLRLFFIYPQLEHVFEVNASLTSCTLQL
jgi:hypothetical protein